MEKRFSRIRGNSVAIDQSTSARFHWDANEYRRNGFRKIYSVAQARWKGFYVRGELSRAISRGSERNNCVYPVAEGSNVVLTTPRRRESDANGRATRTGNRIFVRPVAVTKIKPSRRGIHPLWCGAERFDRLPSFIMLHLNFDCSWNVPFVSNGIHVQGNEYKFVIDPSGFRVEVIHPTYLLI